MVLNVALFPHVASSHFSRAGARAVCSASFPTTALNARPRDQETLGLGCGRRGAVVGGPDPRADANSAMGTWGL